MKGWTGHSPYSPGYTCLQCALHCFQIFTAQVVFFKVFFGIAFVLACFSSCWSSMQSDCLDQVCCAWLDVSRNRSGCISSAGHPKLGGVRGGILGKDAVEFFEVALVNLREKEVELLCNGLLHCLFICVAKQHYYSRRLEHV